MNCLYVFCIFLLYRDLRISFCCFLWWMDDIFDKFFGINMFFRKDLVGGFFFFIILLKLDVVSFLFFWNNYFGFSDWWIVIFFICWDFVKLMVIFLMILFWSWLRIGGVNKLFILVNGRLGKGLIFVFWFVIIFFIGLFILKIVWDFFLLNSW